MENYQEPSYKERKGTENAQKDIELRLPVRKRRSEMRYRASSLANFFKDFNIKPVVEFSEFSGEEEAALIMIMVSRGFTDWVNFVSQFKSSENDVLFTKIKDLHENNKLISKKNGSEMKETDNVGMEIVVAGYFDNDETKNDDFQNTLYELDMGKESDVGMEIVEAGFFNTDGNKSNFKCKKCKKNFPSYHALGGHRSKKCYGRSGKVVTAYKPEMKNCDYECPICFKKFASGQALGGHKRVHNKKKGVMAKSDWTESGFEPKPLAICE